MAIAPPYSDIHSAHAHSKAKIKPSLPFWAIWRMSFGFLGIQFGFALQNANTSRIFETLGASIDAIPLLWIAAPATGLLVQPLVGHFSDRTWTRLGRRRPYFLVGAILSTLALFIMPNSGVLLTAALTLWVLDASINISMEPSRALVADNLPSSQRTLGFAVQSFFIGLGAVIASALPYILSEWFGFSNSAPPGIIPDTVRLSFYIGGAVFLAAVLISIIYTQEYHPDDLHAFTAHEQHNHPTHHHTGLRHLLHDFVHMPKIMKQLSVVQFLSWFALFSMWIYTTPAITSHIYHTTDTSSALYNEGANWVGVCFAAYNGFAALFSFILPALAKKIGRRWVHCISLLVGGLSLISIYGIHEPRFLLLPMLGIGLAWASILAMPYAMLSDAIQSKKMGLYMGLFNFFIVLPQIMAASTWGAITKHFLHGQAIFALLAGGIAMLLAAFSVCLVDKRVS